MKNKTAEDIFNKHCVLVTNDWHEYIILSKEKFIAEIETYASERTRDELIKFLNFAELKRGIFGQYHHVSDKYLDRYVNEFCFRFNERTNNGIFDLTIKRAVNL